MGIVAIVAIGNSAGQGAVGRAQSRLLAFAFADAGLSKLLTPREKLLQNPKMGWAGDFTDAQVKTIGSLEVLGSIGVILPWLLGIARVLTPLAALGLAVTMIGRHRRA